MDTRSCFTTHMQTLKNVKLWQQCGSVGRYKICDLRNMCECLNYSEEKDVAFCFKCIVAFENNHLVPDWFLETTYISTGFLTGYKDAFQKTRTIPAATTDDKMWGKSYHQERNFINRRTKESVFYVSVKCGFSLQARAWITRRRRRWFKFCEMNSLGSEDNNRPTDWIKKKTNKNSSHEMQNEKIKVMAW